MSELQHDGPIEAAEAIGGEAAIRADQSVPADVDGHVESAVGGGVGGDSAGHESATPDLDGAGNDGSGDRVGESGAASGDEDSGAEAAGAGEASGQSSARSRSRVALLEREGEVAADFLERLLDIADLDGDIDVDIDGDRAAVSIVDSEEGRVPRRLVGPDGKVLDALQELTRLAVQTATGERSRLMLDVAGFRADRRSALVSLARESIAAVRASGVSMTMADMTAFERKVVHDEVTAAGLVSESEGVEPHRHIIISPA